ncbi:hypothetical protein BDV96DRAFT_640630 [Lophiotrema nucula]|uniref:Nitroreductase domain-containing protein n=1 Tax=Lophiotrema nucula TaxID=690887 RepID=A0A6A5ZQ04_9PLEO|nr:hypothetical protein BDV96DRAFT_640630 [Lophiotrema nucula]
MFRPKIRPKLRHEAHLRQALNASLLANSSPARDHKRSTATGATRTQQLKPSAMEVESGEQPVTQAIPEPYKKYRSEMGHLLYGPEGYNVGREDKEAMRAAQLRNYSFFEAPLGAIISMDKSLAQVDALSIGMYLQTVCLLLAERGLGTCVAVSVVGYPHVLRKELGLADHMVPLTGLAVGYEDEEKMLNKMRVKRDAHKECVTFVED